VNPTTLGTIITILKADATLTTLLGGQYIYPGYLSQALGLPCVTVTENTESSKKRVGYVNQKTRDQTAVIQVDALVSGGSSAAADAVMARVERVLVSDTVTDTHGWEKIGSGAPEYDEPTRAYHVMARFRFEYITTDS
jgi:hypothetical protein